MPSRNLTESLEEESLKALLSSKTERNGDTPRKAMHGFNTAGVSEEPLDQLGSMVMAGKLQEEDQELHGESAAFLPFVAAGFGAFNQENYDEALQYLRDSIEEAREKANFLKSMGDGLDIRVNRALTTEQVFSDQKFWNIFAETVEEHYMSFVSLKRDAETIMSEDFISGKVTADKALKAVEDHYSVQVPDIGEVAEGFREETGIKMRGPHLYIPAEIAVSRYLEEEFDVNHKLGPATEKIYDKKIADFHDTTRMKQPVKTHSQQGSPATVIPYIAWDTEANRIFASDSAEKIRQKFEDAPLDYLVAEKHPHNGNEGEVLNPVLEKGLYAIEALRMTGEAASLDDTRIASGDELLGYVTEGSYEPENFMEADVDEEAMKELRDGLPEMYDLIDEELDYRTSPERQ
jgi:hypothetical protein